MGVAFPISASIARAGDFLGEKRPLFGQVGVGRAQFAACARREVFRFLRHAAAPTDPFSRAESQEFLGLEIRFHYILPIPVFENDLPAPSCLFRASNSNKPQIPIYLTTGVAGICR